MPSKKLKPKQVTGKDKVALDYWQFELKKIVKRLQRIAEGLANLQ